jgi:catechol 2,3-dioxygenase-like lactoylglutathione lyase family enzyme
MQRRHRLILVLCLAFFALPRARAFGGVTAVARIAMNVDDMNRSVEFYTHVLDFKKVSDIEVTGEQYEKLYGVFGVRLRIAQLTLGSETIELTEFLTPRGKLIPRDSRSNDRWFQHIAIVTSDMDRAYQRLRDNNVRYASTGPQTLPSWNENAGGIKAFYFRDPDDHVLEVIWFPQGKGDPKWQRRTEFFPGIDHTAIVVKDTTSSLRYYRDLLGMRVAGNSENYGTEQEHLNNVAGAHLKITGLRSQSGPGVEFLEYGAPTDGRPYPIDAKTNDLLAWHTCFVTTDAAGLLHDLRDRGFAVVSDSAQPSGSPFLARDPDGHLVKVIQP